MSLAVLVEEPSKLTCPALLRHVLAMTRHNKLWSALMIASAIYGTSIVCGFAYGWVSDELHWSHQPFANPTGLALLLLLTGFGVGVTRRSDPGQWQAATVCLASFAYAVCLGMVEASAWKSDLTIVAIWGLALAPFGVAIWFLVWSRAWIGAAGAALIVFAGSGLVMFCLAGNRGYGLIIRIMD